MNKKFCSFIGLFDCFGESSGDKLSNWVTFERKSDVCTFLLNSSRFSFIPHWVDCLVNWGSQDSRFAWIAWLSSLEEWRSCDWKCKGCIFLNFSRLQWFSFGISPCCYHHRITFFPQFTLSGVYYWQILTSSLGFIPWIFATTEIPEIHIIVKFA